MIDIQDLKNLSINASRNLIEMLNEKKGFTENKFPNLQTKMIFPTYERKLYENAEEKNEKVRPSEQEARSQFCLAIERYYKEIYYSIETPTRFNYKFSQEKTQTDIINTSDSKKRKEYGIFKPDPRNYEVGSSARFDVSLFERENGSLKQKVDIEFKFQSPDPDNIRKDILKLFAESNNGMFFHFIYSNRSKAFQNDLEKFIYSIEETQRDLNANDDILQLIEINHDDCILFVILILDEKVLLLKELKNRFANEYVDFFKIDYKGASTKEPDLNGWELINLNTTKP